MSYETIRYEVADTGVATVTLDQPDTRNALSAEMLGELLDAFRSAQDHEAVRCVVLTSSHERVFSSGANLAAFGADTPLINKHLGSKGILELFRLIAGSLKPTICAANGHVLAGSFGIALACDLIIAKDTAKFGTPEVAVGAFPFMVAALAYRNVPRKKANELMLLGELMTAQEALEAGFVNRVVARGRVRGGRRGVGREARREVAGHHAPRQGGARAPGRHEPA